VSLQELPLRAVAVVNDMALFYPIAECGGTADAAAEPYDRRWLIANDAGLWVTRDICPKLAGVAVELRLGYLVLRAPGMLRMDIPLDVIEDDDSVRYTLLVAGQEADVIDEGELAAAWISNYVQTPCRILKLHPDTPAVNWGGLTPV
jgi:hypothetical protein